MSITISHLLHIEYDLSIDVALNAVMHIMFRFSPQFSICFQTDYTTPVVDRPIM